MKVIEIILRIFKLIARIFRPRRKPKRSHEEDTPTDTVPDPPLPPFDPEWDGGGSSGNHGSHPNDTLPPVATYRTARYPALAGYALMTSGMAGYWYKIVFGG